MGLTISADDGRVACIDSIDAFVRAVQGFDEYALLGASRCHGWSRLEAVTHMIAGWQEMLAGLVSAVEDAPTVDAATYWTAFAAEFGTDDPVPDVMSQRRRASSYARPASAVAHLKDVAVAARRRVLLLDDRPLTWQGHVFTAGDFFAIWAVESVIHQLDLLSDEPAPQTALALTRRTIEALAGRPLPDDWTDDLVALVGSGREPAPTDTETWAEVLPVLC